MTDYFASIISSELLGVTRGNITIKPLVKATNEKIVPPISISGKEGTRGNENLDVVPPVTPNKINEILLCSAEIKKVPPVTPVFIDQEQFYYLYQERCAIKQFDGNLTQQEAELSAYQETLRSFIENLYPLISAQFEHIILQPILH